MKVRFPIALLLLYYLNLPAQQYLPHQAPFIDVQGRAEMEVVPDQIFIAINLSSSEEDLKKNYSIQQKEDSLKAVLLKMKISLEQLRLTGANGNMVQVSWFREGLVQNKHYRLVVKDAETAGAVFSQLDGIGIQNCYIARVDHSGLSEFRKENRIAAIKAAKAKADYLLEAIGEQTGPALKVQELDPSNPNAQSNSNVRGSRSEGRVYFIDGVKVRGALPGTTQFEKIKIISVVQARFAIKEPTANIAD